jgi:NAD(P)-dependent dehydrogenase (short-subunit alcohol dehydrogenase family)
MSHDDRYLSGRVAVVVAPIRRGPGDFLVGPVADRLAGEGAEVAVLTTAPEAGTSSEAVAVHLEAASEGSIDAAFDEVRSTLGPANVLVNLTTSRDFAALRSDSTQHFHAVLEETAGVAMCTTKAFAAGIEDHGGRIVNLVAFHAFRGLPCHGAIAAGSGALLSFSRAMATELAPQRITVNVVEPGFWWDGEIAADDVEMIVPTDWPNGVVWDLPGAMGAILASGGGAAEVATEFGVLTTPARPTSPVEVAGAVRYLVGPYTESVTGFTLHLNGGMSFGTSRKPAHPPWAIT